MFDTGKTHQNISKYNEEQYFSKRLLVLFSLSRFLLVYGFWFVLVFQNTINPGSGPNHPVRSNAQNPGLAPATLRSNAKNYKNIQRISIHNENNVLFCVFFNKSISTNKKGYWHRGLRMLRLLRGASGAVPCSRSGLGHFSALTLVPVWVWVTFRPKTTKDRQHKPQERPRPPT